MLAITFAALCALAMLFFFSSRRRHTRSLCDWSSDVCSSDLDDDQGFVGPALAELLGWPHVATITKVVPVEGGVELWREVEGGHEVWKAALPALATVHKSEKEPRYPSLPGIMKAKKKDIPERAIGALGVDASGPSWTILSMEPPAARGGGKILKDGDSKQIAEQLATALRDEAKVL